MARSGLPRPRPTIDADVEAAVAKVKKYADGSAIVMVAVRGA